MTPHPTRYNNVTAKTSLQKFAVGKKWRSRERSWRCHHHWQRQESGCPTGMGIGLDRKLVAQARDIGSDIAAVRTYAIARSVQNGRAPSRPTLMREVV